ncbi:G-D-S-L family lipolytic protein [Muricauda sp. DJ-13]|uniref:G-D-S-L family lipolytic protein n=1 Tax=Croceivirga thetidis TaxID=2721623 RepID=A0ABX1GSH5_9FLAO|nr:G-D-S-L family lipolytic protein [Croceivirga thetidis]
MLLSLFLLLSGLVFGQKNVGYSQEVNNIQERIKKTWNHKESAIVFTGSSSIRLWKDLQERFPQTQILNTGFGGSESYDLLGYIDELVINYNPKKVFVYEGDNDIANGKKWREILNNLERITDKIHKKLPNTEVYLISAKPSIDRWKLRRKYRRLNKEIKNYAQRVAHVTFVDVWQVMLNGRKLNKSLFIEDGLHMTKDGYDIWEKELKPHVN